MYRLFINFNVITEGVKKSEKLDAVVKIIITPLFEEDGRTAVSLPT